MPDYYDDEPDIESIDPYIGGKDEVILFEDEEDRSKDNDLRDGLGLITRYSGKGRRRTPTTISELQSIYGE